jgi:hypothetical protein
MKTVIISLLLCVFTACSSSNPKEGSASPPWSSSSNLPTEAEFSDDICAAMAACMEGINCDSEPIDSGDTDTCDFDARAAQACLEGLGACEGEEPFMMPAGLDSLACASVCGPTDGTDTTLCENTCTYSNDGQCDDGGPGADYSICDLGTDCNDCGPR